LIIAFACKAKSKLHDASSVTADACQENKMKLIFYLGFVTLGQKKEFTKLKWGMTYRHVYLLYGQTENLKTIKHKCLFKICEVLKMRYHERGFYIVGFILVT
jgi:hypothetical protein